MKFKHEINKLPITAIVVGLNEGELLPKCFQGISFCSQVLYFDLGSLDNSIRIANDFGAEVIEHEKVPGCEWIHSKYANRTQFEWVLIIDPDEYIDPMLALEIEKKIKSIIPDNIGAFLVPIIYYFGNKKLNGTPWGGAKSKVLFVHNRRFQFTPNVHVGRKLKAGYSYEKIEFNSNNVIHHYWMRDFSKLFEKHKRYLENEGKARFAIGERTTLSKILICPFKHFYFSLIIKCGYKDRILGIFLSFFWAFYQTFALISLWKYQRNVGAHKNSGSYKF